MNKIKTLDTEKILSYLIVVYAFLIPISRAGIVLLSILIILLWLFKADIKNDIKFFLQNKFILLFFTFVIYSFIAMLWSSNLDEGMNYATRYWYYLPMIIIAANLKKEYFGLVISAFLLSMFISELLSYGMFFELIDWKNRSSPYATPFMNHLQYSAFVVFTSLFLLNHIFYVENIKMKLLYTLFFITLTINLFINGGRIGYVAFFISIFLVFILSIKNKIKAFLISLFIITSSLFLAYNFSSTFQTRLSFTIEELKEIKSEKYHTSFGQRIAMFYMGGIIIKDNLVFGVGTGDEMYIIKELVSTDYKQFDYLKKRRHLHNVFLHITVQLGIIGLVILVLLFYSLYKVKIKDKYFSNVKYIFITVYLITCLTGNMFHQQFTMALFGLFAGLILAQNRIERRRELL